MPLVRVVHVHRAFNRAADRAPRLLEGERSDELLIGASFADASVKRRVLVLEAVDARTISNRQQPARGLRVGKEVVLYRGREANRALVVEECRSRPRSLLSRRAAGADG